MNRRVLAVVALAAMLALAGCSSYLSDAGGSPSDDLSTVAPGGGATTPTTTSTDATAPDSTPTDTPIDETDTAPGDTATPEPWSPPSEPNKPLEHALNDSQGNRIGALAQVNDEPGNATGDVTLAVRANTSMSNVDPADMGTVRGEPFFLVYVNGSLHPGGEWAGSSFYRVEGTLGVNTDQVTQRDEGTYELTVPAGAFEAEGAEGEVDVMVLLMDQDKQWDDVYGVANTTVDYELPSDPGNDTATATATESTGGDGDDSPTETEPTPDGSDDEQTTEDEETTTESLFDE